MTKSKKAPAPRQPALVATIDALVESATAPQPKAKGALKRAQMTAEATAAEATKPLMAPEAIAKLIEAEQIATAVVEAVEAEQIATAVVEVPAPQVDAMKVTKTVAKAAKAETTKKPKRTVRIVEQDGRFAIVIVNPRPGAETDRPPWTHKTRKACEADCARNGWVIQ